MKRHSIHSFKFDALDDLLVGSKIYEALAWLGDVALEPAFKNRKSQ
jgi:hypothetical protein